MLSLEASFWSSSEFTQVLIILNNLMPSGNFTSSLIPGHLSINYLEFISMQSPGGLHYSFLSTLETVSVSSASSFF